MNFGAILKSTTAGLSFPCQLPRLPIFIGSPQDHLAGLAGLTTLGINSG